MTRDLATELDALRADVNELTQQVRTLLAAAPSPSTGRPGSHHAPHDPVPAAASDALDASAGPHARAASDESVVGRHTDRLVALAQAKGLSGVISYAGYYTASDTYGRRESRWVTEERAAEDLLGQDDGQVARVLAALGNRQRLALLKAILQKPTSVTELVAQLGLGTTGQAYHHLKALQAADLVEQEQRGLFAIKPHRIQSILLLLAGVYDMLDGRYSSGAWSDDAESHLPASDSPSKT